jgi:CheY-like chemotaxis protein
MVRVLVVEDESALRTLLEGVLRAVGWEVRSAPNGAVALEVSAEWQPDLILLDLMMPVRGGWAFLKHYRERDEDRTPALVVSAVVEQLPSVDDLGVVGVLAKPFDLEQPLELVEELRPRR